jgi:hypothetical protein
LPAAGTGLEEFRNPKNEIHRRDDMCPACIENTVVMVAGAGSTAGILAVCIGKVRKFFSASSFVLIQKAKEQ